MSAVGYSSDMEDTASVQKFEKEKPNTERGWQATRISGLPQTDITDLPRIAKPLYDLLVISQSTKQGSKSSVPTSGNQQQLNSHRIS